MKTQQKKLFAYLKLTIPFVECFDVEMKVGLPNFAIVVLLLLCSLHVVLGIRFVIDREECFSHNVSYESDTVHVSFVVIKVDTSWTYSVKGVDFVVSTMLINSSI